MDLQGVNHIAFLTSDLERLSRFYEELFGARTVVELPIPEPEGPGRHALISVGAAPRCTRSSSRRSRRHLSDQCSNGGASTISP